MSEEKRAYQAIDKELVRDIIWQRWKIQLPDDDLMWIFVDVMDATNQQLMVRSRHYIQHELRTVLKETRTQLRQENDALIETCAQSLSEKLAHLTTQSITQPLQKSCQLIDEQRAYNEAIYTRLGFDDLDDVVRSCRHSAVASYCVGLVAIAVILWPLISSLL